MASIYRLGSSWRAQVRLKGKPAQSQVFSTKAEAVAWAREVEGALHKVSTDDHLTPYSDIHRIYVENSRPGGTSKQHVLEKLRRYWGNHRIAEINTTSISNYIITRSRDGLSPSSIMKELIYLGVVLQHGGILSGNDEALRARAALTAAIKTHRTLGTVDDSVERSRRPTEDELVRLEDYFFHRPRSQTPVWDTVLFAVTTALRLGEICGQGGVQWEDFDESSRILWIRGRKDPTTPGGRDESIPLLRGPVTLQGNIIDPVEIILRQRSARRKFGRIFPFAENTVGQAFSIACRKQGIKDLRFHDLRHDAISRLFEAGYSIPEVARVSGHKSWKHLQRYTQIRPETLHNKAALATNK